MLTGNANLKYNIIMVKKAVLNSPRAPLCGGYLLVINNGMIKTQIIFCRGSFQISEKPALT